MTQVNNANNVLSYLLTSGQQQNVSDLITLHYIT